MDRTDRRLLVRWAFLVSLTFASFESAWGLGWMRNPVVAIAIVIGVALIKVRLVILDFMEVRRAPLALRLALELWVVALAGGILGLWYAAGA
ncbi:MAG: cytochrome C oxidase subunit IV family protein [Sphingomonadales bacterium]|nr:cytochrome C oxidase subunit IV family protein [Sphingomonadales bacterium]